MGKVSELSELKRAPCARFAHRAEWPTNLEVEILVNPRQCRQSVECGEITRLLQRRARKTGACSIQPSSQQLPKSSQPEPHRQRCYSVSASFICLTMMRRFPLMCVQCRHRFASAAFPMVTSPWHCEATVAVGATARRAHSDSSCSSRMAAQSGVCWFGCAAETIEHKVQENETLCMHSTALHCALVLCGQSLSQSVRGRLRR